MPCGALGAASPVQASSTGCRSANRVAFAVAGATPQFVAGQAVPTLAAFRDCLNQFGPPYWGERLCACSLRKLIRLLGENSGSVFASLTGCHSYCHSSTGTA